MSKNTTCPSCSELAVIHEALKDYAIYDEESPLVSLSMMLTELKMWRAKDEYDKKLKVVLGNAIFKQMKEEDISGSQMDSSFYGLN
jgi:hypothetical protein